MDLPILYEDTDLVAVAKPAGLITHSDGRTEEPTAEEWFIERYGKGSEEAPTGYVHRLDRDTSGVLLFAKTPQAYARLRQAFHDRAIAKTYLAVTYGAPKVKKGKIDFDIGRSRSDFRLRSAQPKAKGTLREALTEYEVLAETPEYGLMKLMPKTGRTHQIRVHLKAIHHPIVGDTLYAPHKKSPESLPRLALHAYSLTLPRGEGGALTVTAPIPQDLAGMRELFPLATREFAEQNKV